MFQSKSTIAALAGIALCAAAESALAEDSCAAVYQYATRDIDIQTRVYQQLDYVFDNYCSKDGSKQTFTMSDSVGVIFDDLPFDFKSSKGATNERVTEFCKLYSSQRYVNNRYFRYKNEVQVAALNAFNQCIALSKQGIEISYTPNGMIGGSVNGRFKDRETSLAINAVSYDKSMVSCKLSSADFDAAQDIDDSKPVKVNKNFTIVCRRQPKTENGKTYYPETDVRVDTSSGGYSVHFEGDALNGFYDANDAKAKYDQAHASLDQASKDITALQNRLKNVKAEVHLYNTGQDQAVPCERTNEAGLAAYEKSVCKDKIPSRTYLQTGIPGGHCGYNHLAVACIDTGQ